MFCNRNLWNFFATIHKNSWHNEILMEVEGVIGEPMTCLCFTFTRRIISNNRIHSKAVSQDIINKVGKH